MQLARYYNNLDKTLTWAGRELSTYTNSGTLTTYKYDASGIRLSKTTSGTVTNYLYNGSNLIREKNGTDTIWYLYDQNGMIGFELNGVTYYYVRNLQGDITRIINTSGTAVATYTYDAWGKCTVGTNTSGIADKNPIRYRGYYYDVESGFYYLNSRYYDPEVGRFISPDVVAEGGNLYTYCLNDPINYCDPYGYFVLVIFGVVITAAQILTGIAILAGGAIVISIESETHVIENTLTGIANTIESLWQEPYKGKVETFPNTDAHVPSIPNNPSVPNTITGYLPNYYPINIAVGNIALAKNKAPAGRPGIIGQGKEGVEKKKGNPNWQNKSGKRRPSDPKKHTPGRDHNKFKNKQSKLLVLIPFDTSYWED